ncbi:MAG: hypothetical protein WC867_03300 [Candidatus Pacearchaeota archaeon]|jgi:hypothetical protein
MLDKSCDNQQRRYAAIRKGLELACSILGNVQDCEKIKTQYSQLLYQKEIAQNLDIARRFDVSDRVAVTAVGFAIRGYYGGLYEAFDGLFEESILEKLEKDHVARRNEEIYLRSAGLYSQDTETRKVICKMALEKRGVKPITKDEIELVFKCSKDPNYQHTNGKIRKPNLELISEEINKILHNGQKIRNKKSIGNILYRKK